ncbi:exonuclease SbcCD subunit D [Halocynthiibacter styelae]|uniref:Nuclease SbcCD subunit D n=1 Tax=Halocynthiibacter styelae TaxID=2761955 RepID=A0A8J7IZT1_9RHOB|nr:exonuclease SbcCD subunit D [Paenihalocynthiibacter styelae]MBI1495445.1 exonuclease SbcCD subunit D [Paenihalocynthiibacter styelae]
MRILHTADWHIGQTLNGWARDGEHQAWLDKLAHVLVQEQIDVLLVAGDVYDGVNPSGASQHILYTALRKFKDARPGLLTFITSGNHDPAGRLEAPAAILEGLDVHVVASVRRIEDEIDIASHMFPIPDENGSHQAWVCAIPFLRSADLPDLNFNQSEGRGSPIVDAARRFHLDIARKAREHAGDLPILAMGHLHCHGATESALGEVSAERRILIGGEHALPEDVFPEEFNYVALGHLHRPQTLGGGRIRYSGSCFPLSAAEVSYDHGVTLIDLEGGEYQLRHHSIDRPVPMVRLPAEGAMDIARLEEALDALDLDPELPGDLQTFVYVNLTAEGPASVLLAEAEKLLAKYPLRTAGVRVRRQVTERHEEPPQSLSETTPEDLFNDAFVKANGVTPGARHTAAFREAMIGE